jgi:AraC-like DNA-binding protein
MSPGLSFHIAPRALNLDRAFSPRHLFADSVRHVIDGHVASDPYYRIATNSTAVALNESALERRMRELFALDLNPLICMTRQLGSELALFRAWNTYQKHVSLAVRTVIHGTSNESFRVDRRQIFYAIDPPAARSAGLCAIDILRGAARSNRERGHVADDPAKWRLSRIAADLGLQHTVVFEAALYFEEDHGLNVTQLCRTLGCHKRTLERHFKDFGLTAENLKMASALAGATNSLWGTSSLTEIAFEHGFSDQAHMTRAFRHACGMPPSVLRRLVSH